MLEEDTWQVVPKQLAPDCSQEASLWQRLESLLSDMRSWPLISLWLEFLWNSRTQKQLSCKGEYTLQENQISNHHIFPTQFGFILCISWFCSSEISPLWSSGLTSNLIVWRKFTNFFVCLFKRERVQACWIIREQEEEAHAVFGPAPPYVRFWSWEATPLTLGNGALHGSMWTALPGKGCIFSYSKRLQSFSLFFAWLDSWSKPQGIPPFFEDWQAVIFLVTFYHMHCCCWLFFLANFRNLATKEKGWRMQQRDFWDLKK